MVRNGFAKHFVSMSQIRDRLIVIVDIAKTTKLTYKLVYMQLKIRFPRENIFVQSFTYFSFVFLTVLFIFTPKFLHNTKINFSRNTEKNYYLAELRVPMNISVPTLHCKKRLLFFLSSAGMSLTKYIIPGRE